MPNPVLTVDTARTLMRQIVASKPADYRYVDPATVTPGTAGTGCFYLDPDAPTNDAEPSCIIGHLLVALGVPKETIEDHYEGLNAHEVLIDAFPDIDELLATALQKAQSEQDKGKTWPEALAAFESYL